MLLGKEGHNAAQPTRNLGFPYPENNTATNLKCLWFKRSERGLISTRPFGIRSVVLCPATVMTKIVYPFSFGVIALIMVYTTIIAIDHRAFNQRSILRNRWT